PRQARAGVRRRRGSRPDGFRRRHRPQDDDRLLPDHAAQPQGRARQGPDQGEPVPLDDLGDPAAQRLVREGRCAYHPLRRRGPRERRESRHLRREVLVVAVRTCAAFAGLWAASMVGVAWAGPPGQGDEGPSLTVYSSADPAGFDPQQYVSQARAGGGAQYAWQVPGFGVVKEI